MVTVEFIKKDHAENAELPATGSLADSAWLVNHRILTRPLSQGSVFGRSGHAGKSHEDATGSVACSMCSVKVVFIMQQNTVLCWVILGSAFCEFFSGANGKTMLLVGSCTEICRSRAANRFVIPCSPKVQVFIRGVTSTGSSL